MLFELQLISSIQQVATSSPLLIALVDFLARWLVLAFAVLAVFLVVSNRKKYRHAVLEAAWAGILALVLRIGLSNIIQRPRPFMMPQDVDLTFSRLIPFPVGSSFPSGHTAVVFAIAAAFAYANPRLGIAAFIVAFLVAFGRLAAGVHYPTDILGGIVVGLVSFWFVRFMHHQLRKRDIIKSAEIHKHE
ncbi:phosphatase PAP2 family protein [Patescibacteria group bacterium]|nr:phosphatase PAP2 family protein [Patescibacteria group bacterium]